MKKGFTLIELIAVIALLGILVTLTSISVVRLKKSTEEKLLNQKIEYVKTGAIKWGEDHLNLLSPDTCTYIDISSLINNNYINGDSDDNSKLLIPGTNEFFQGNVCVRYKDIHSDISNMSGYASNYGYNDYANYQVTAEYELVGGQSDNETK